MKKLITRRKSIKSLGTLGVASVAAANLPGNEAFGAPAIPSRGAASDARVSIFAKVFATPFIDSHEHLIEEKGRLSGASHPRVPADDWSLLFSHYINSDLQTAGMTNQELERFFSPVIDPVDKWRTLEPYWLAVKNTGYGQASNIAIRELYGVEELSAATVRKVQDGYQPQMPWNWLIRLCTGTPGGFSAWTRRRRR